MFAYCVWFQCQSQLKTLYAEGIEGCHMEFSAYNLLCVILHSNNYRDLLSSMSRSVIAFIYRSSNSPGLFYFVLDIVHDILLNTGHNTLMHTHTPKFLRVTSITHMHMHLSHFPSVIHMHVCTGIHK